MSKNVDIDDMNNIIKNKIAGETMTYKSIDSVKDQCKVVKIPKEFRNSLYIPGLLTHILKLI